jgi:hypothetical protein
MAVDYGVYAMTQAHLSFAECCDAIIKHSNVNALNYAVNYAKAGRNMAGKDARVQALYILNNITQWRGEEATRVRSALKIISKEK